MGRSSPPSSSLGHTHHVLYSRLDHVHAFPAEEVFNLIHPVGSIVHLYVSTNPATLFGFGTWVQMSRGRVLIGEDGATYTAAGQTGGAATVSSAGSVAAPTIAWPAGVPTAANESSHTHSVTSNVSVGAHSPTQPTIAWPVGVPTAANESSHTHSVTSNVTIADHASHTHSVTSNVTVADHGSHTHTYTDVVNHTHTVTSVASSASGATTNLAGTNDTSSTTAVTANPSGGVATGTTAGPNATLTHTPTNNAVTSAGPSVVLTHTPTNNAVTSGAGSSHTHTLSWPAGVPTASGGGVDAHAVTNNAVTSAAGSAHTHTLSWPAGVPTASAPAFTGSATSVIQPYEVCYIWRRSA